jgi:hypothetical protein
LILTGQDIFNQAMDLISKRKPDGTIDENKTKVYNARSPGLLTMWQNEIELYLGTTLSEPITSLTDTITVNDKSSGAYFLAANFLLVEDPDSASFFQQKFEELRKLQLNRQVATEEDIEDSYSWSSSEGW